jgi:hypothetical protein
MEEEMGLAQRAAAEGAGGMGQGMPSPQELAELLLQGITPQELQEAGVPVELIEQAIAIAKQMSQMPQETGMSGAMSMPVGQEGGLATKAAMGM